MIIQERKSFKLIVCLLFSSAVLYGVLYFNYFETPSGDFIGNIRPLVVDYMQGNFPGEYFKFLPVFPLLLTVLTPINPYHSYDVIFFTALILNFILFIPYLWVIYKVFRLYLDDWLAAGAMLFLFTNIYTIFTAVNSELEMVLTLLVVLSLYLTIKESPWAYVTSFFAASTKWDAVFTIPAVMFRDFFIRKKRIIALLLGAVATSGVALWLLISILKSNGSHPYVSEIAQRGPNIYRYLIDCILITAGFSQWMALHGYYSGNPLIAVPLFTLLAVYTIIIAVSVIWGAIIFFRKKITDRAPILIFFAGFLIIHMIYQNTKERYVLPILWLLVIFLFYGIAFGLYPKIKKYFEKMASDRRHSAQILAILLSSLIYLPSSIMLVSTLAPFQILFAALFTVIALFIAYYSGKFTAWRSLAIVVLLAGTVINFQVYYGIRTMDHYSLTRVEFKHAALWYKEKYINGNKMMMTEINVPMYFSKFDRSRFVESFAIKSKNLQELINECNEKKITYVFVDDFYIRRLKVHDQNAIDRKAYLFKEVLEGGEKSGHFKLVTSFETKGDIHSFLYRFIP